MVFMIAGAAIYLLKPSKSQVSLAGFGTGAINIFDSYTSWPSSSTLDPTDTVAQTLFLVADGHGLSHTIVDMNGDGLSDVIYHASASDWGQFAIFLNTGGNEFELVYKCAKMSGVYYGDCAAL